MLAVYYDAWINDNDDDPVYSMIYEISKQLNIRYEITDTNIFKLGATILESFSGIKINDYIEVLKSEDTVSRFVEEKTIEEKNKEFFTSLLEERANKLVVFVDELDRCKPTFAVKLLERIKHYFNDERVVFVFSTNLNQLQYTVQQYYGQEFNATRYLNRFFNVRIRLSQPDLTKLYDKVGINRGYAVDDQCRKIIELFDFQMRDISIFYSSVLRAVDKTLESKSMEFSFSDGEGKRFIMYAIVPLMIGLDMHDKEIYREFVEGSNMKPLLDLLSIESNEYLISHLMEQDEDLKGRSGKKLVSRSEIISKLYNSIFNNKSEGMSGGSVKLGKCEFNAKSKGFALKCISMISKYNTY